MVYFMIIFNVIVVFYAGIKKDQIIKPKVILLYVPVGFIMIINIIFYIKQFGLIIEEFVAELSKKLNTQNDLKHILDNLEEGIIVINENQIEFVNDTFLTQLQKLIIKQQKKKDDEKPLNKKTRYCCFKRK